MPAEDRPAYLRLNRANWDARAAAHAASPGYAVDRFLADPTFISGVVAFDRPRLGDIAGLVGVHLQCHIGTDTLSLHRLGARMSGLDLSPASLAEARRLAEATGADITYVEADVYRALEVLPAAGFDLVYTGVGALPWLPDIRRWAAVVAGLLRPGGRLLVREQHPMLWTVDDARTEEVVIRYPYYEVPEPLVSVEDGTYVEVPEGTSFSHNETHLWNHGLGQTVTALLDAGMIITAFEEHDSVPWNAIPGQMVSDDRGEWRLVERPERLAASYTLQAVRRA